RSDIDVMDSLRRERLRPADVVNVVRVAAINENVTAFKVRREIGDGLVDDPRRDHQPHRPRLLELAHEACSRGRPYRLVACQIPYRLRRYVENHALMAALEKSPDHIGAHAAETDHS